MGTALQRVRGSLDPTIRGWYVLDAALAGVLSVFVALGVGGVLPGHRASGAAAALFATVMTLPVAWRRRWPVTAAAVLAIGAIGNAVVFGSLVRCGSALPAVFAAGYALNRLPLDRLRGYLGLVLALVLCSINVISQAYSDPQLGSEVIWYMLVVLYGFCVLGLLVRSRTMAATALEARSAELHRQREETARLQVAVDRASLSRQLAAELQGRVDRLATAAMMALPMAESDPAAAGSALAAIEHDGRDVLGRMRRLVGGLDEPAPSAPQPTVDEIPALLARIVTHPRLVVDGERRRLSGGLELSGYRIVEALLTALDTSAAAGIDVRLHYGADALEVRVSGPPATGADLGSVLVVVGERVSLYRGTLDSHVEAGLYRGTARMPLVSAGA